MDLAQPALKVLREVAAYEADRHVLTPTINSSDGLVGDVLRRLGLDALDLRAGHHGDPGAPQRLPHALHRGQ